MNRKTFAVDIDGTITENGGGRIHLEALAALRHVKKYRSQCDLCDW